MHSCDFSAIFIFIIVVWTIGQSSNAIEVNETKYDSSSVEQNEKILRLLLRLAFHTATHLVRLKDASKIRAENEVDKDLYDITMNDIIHGISMNQHNSNEREVTKKKSLANTDNSDIQSRFFNLLPQTFQATPLKKVQDTMTTIVSGDTSGISNITTDLESMAAGGSELLQNIQDRSANALNETIGQVVNPKSLSNSTSLQETGGKILSATAILNSLQSANVSDMKSMNPLVRLLPNSDGENITNTTEQINGMDKVEGRFDSIVHILNTTTGTDTTGHVNQSSSSASSVIKRETSPVPVSVSTHAKNQTNNDHISVGNFSTSNITDSSNDANVTKGEEAIEGISLRLQSSTDKGNRMMSCEKDTRDIFQNIFNVNDMEEDDYDSDVVKLIEKMKLLEFSNQLVNGPQPL